MDGEPQEILDLRDEEGNLPGYALPGCYPLSYLTKDGLWICPECANNEVDAAQAVIGCEANWEDAQLYCQDCGRRIVSAYAEDEA